MSETFQNLLESFLERHQTDDHKEIVQLYKEQIDFLKHLVKEKEDMYHVQAKALDKKK